jgi:hypothetical protein
MCVVQCYTCAIRYYSSIIVFIGRFPRPPFVTVQVASSETKTQPSTAPRFNVFVAVAGIVRTARVNVITAVLHAVWCPYYCTNS